LADGSTVNQIKRVCHEAQQHQGSAEELIGMVESGIMKVQPKGDSDPVNMQIGMTRVFQDIEELSKHRGISGLSTGFPDLDRSLDGLHTGELVIVAGRPSMGKTAMAVNIGQHVAKNHGVLMFSLEMTANQLHKRMISTSTRIPFSRIRGGNLTPNDWNILTSGADALNKLNFYTDETPGIALQTLVSKARRMKRKHDLKLVIVDYLQLMTLPRNESRVSALGHVTRSLKNLSKELDVNIVLLSQLSRAVDSREDKRPVMSDLRESGEIEQDADVILFPFREAAYCRDCRDRRNTATHNYQKHQHKAEVIIEKQRNGERNISVPVCWMGAYCCFESLTYSAEAAA
jgi:replicative DNA helicase